jgi:hypothetical protein
MPIPAPGTAALLVGVPLASSAIQAELTTPTGAAILTTVVTEWTETPAMTIERIGHGAGKRTFPEQPNLLRLMVGASAPSEVLRGFEQDSVWVLETNLDDVAAEVIGYCFERLFAAGALDVYTVPITMKKNRPGVMLCALCSEANLVAVEEVLFRETGTLGIRRHSMGRAKLGRKSAKVETPWGAVAGKIGMRGGKAVLFTPEFEACARVARENNLPLREVYQRVQQFYNSQQPSDPS